MVSADAKANDLETWDNLWGRAHAIINKCVKGQGMGGWTPAGKLLAFPSQKKRTLLTSG